MATQIAVARRNLVGKTLSLPEWVRPLQDALEIKMQKVENGFAEVATLPAALIPSETQRAEIVARQNSISAALNETPENGEDWAIATAEITTKLMLTLGGQKNELAAEARGEAYADVLEDVPWWAVKAAVRAWYRGEPRNDRGERYDFAWAPDPATLRRIAMGYVYRAKAEMSAAQSLLDARPFVDCSADLERGQSAYRGLMLAIGRKDNLQELTFEKALEIGK